MARLEDLDISRGAGAMSKEQAAAIAWRVQLHLYRGSIELAREALEDGWRDHLLETAELPIGPALMAEPLCRVIGEIRTLNMLEKEGIHTIGHLVKLRREDLISIPHLGDKTADRLLATIAAMRKRSKA